MKKPKRPSFVDLLKLPAISFEKALEIELERTSSMDALRKLEASINSHFKGLFYIQIKKNSIFIENKESRKKRRKIYTRYRGNTDSRSATGT